MCGIAGFFDHSSKMNGKKLREAVSNMSETLLHRGPDGTDVWVDAETGVAIGHRRLSIIDLSSAGRQPMLSADGRYVVAYNGEVYNFEELREELESCGTKFRGHSDTEVIVEGSAVWGIEKTVERLNGMFSIVLWDCQTQTLTLVRDRLGIKPLFWGKFGSLFLFASELKALRAHHGWHPEVNRDALASYLRFSYVPAPNCIYKNIYKLEPGSILTLRPGKEPRIHQYWDMRNVVLEGRTNRVAYDDVEAEERLDCLLRDAIKRRMVADVPLGAFLSGGIDSSVVVALMQKQSDRPVKTFSIGFDESAFNEAEDAKAVANHLETEHTDLYIRHQDAMSVVPKLPDFYDEPFADSSQIPTYLLSKLARRDVTVSLSGDGGDEIFAGYNRYMLASNWWRKIGWAPTFMRRMTAGFLRRVPPVAWDKIFSSAPVKLRHIFTGDRLHKLAEVISLADSGEIYESLISQWRKPETLALGATERKGIISDPDIVRLIPNFMERMQFLDTMTYLPDDILTKVDRASMTVSLEARVPLLDHRVVEFAWTLPSSMKIRGGRSKWLLRQVLARYVPNQLIDRPKKGFSVPIDLWLRGGLRDWAENLLSEDRLRREGFFDPAPIRRLWNEHLSGQKNWQYPIWVILMFQAWKEKWLPE